MTESSDRLIEIGRSFEQTYKPVLDFAGWRVAMLRHFDVVDAESFRRVERHRNTNEIFILTAGRADLILCDGDAEPTAPQVLPMEAHVAYNVRRSVWHHVVMSPEAHIVLLERSDTSVTTTDYADFSPEAARDIMRRFRVGLPDPRNSEFEK